MDNPMGMKWKHGRVIRVEARAQGSIRSSKIKVYIHIHIYVHTDTHISVTVYTYTHLSHTLDLWKPHVKATRTGFRSQRLIVSRSRTRGIAFAMLAHSFGHFAAILWYVDGRGWGHGALAVHVKNGGWEYNPPYHGCPTKNTHEGQPFCTQRP